MRASWESGWMMMTGSSWGTVTYLLGGMDHLLKAFVIFAALDYFTGSVAAAQKGRYNGRFAVSGLVRKIAMLSFIVVANQLDMVSGNEQGFVRNAILMFLIGTEGISILENGRKLGLPIPPFLQSALDRIKDRPENKGGKSS